MIGREDVGASGSAILVRTAILGKKFTAPPITLDEARLYEFSTALGATGGSSTTGIPTFGGVLQQPAMDQLLAVLSALIDVSRILHGEQRFDFHRPLFAGERVDSELVVGGVRMVRRHTHIATECRLSVRGELRVTSFASLVVLDG